VVPGVLPVGAASAANHRPVIPDLIRDPYRSLSRSCVTTTAAPASDTRSPAPAPALP
jgi:hypothetical protein